MKRLINEYKTKNQNYLQLLWDRAPIVIFAAREMRIQDKIDMVKVLIIVFLKFCLKKY